MSGFSISLCILGVLVLFLFIGFLVKGSDEDDSNGNSSVGKGDSLDLIKCKYIHAYQWAAKQVIKNNSVENLEQKYGVSGNTVTATAQERLDALKAKSAKKED